MAYDFKCSFKSEKNILHVNNKPTKLYILLWFSLLSYVILILREIFKPKKTVGFLATQWEFVTTHRKVQRSVVQNPHIIQHSGLHLILRNSTEMWVTSQVKVCLMILEKHQTKEAFALPAKNWENPFDGLSVRRKLLWYIWTVHILWENTVTATAVGNARNWVWYREKLVTTSCVAARCDLLHALIDNCSTFASYLKLSAVFTWRSPLSLY